MEELVLNNLSLIYLVLKKMELYNQRDYYYDAGLLGLIKAAKAFEPSKGYRFTSFATICIRNQILMDIRRHKNELNNHAISLDAPVITNRKDDNILLIDMLPNDLSVEDEYIEKETIKLLRKAISTLNPDEQKLLGYYFRWKNDTTGNIKKNELITSYYL